MAWIQQSAATRALENEIVLEKVARSLPPKDLSRLRRTRRAWNRHFVPELRIRRKPLRLHNFWATTYLLESSSEVPFSKFSIEVPTVEDDFRAFFSAFGIWVTYLEIRTPYPDTLADLSQLRRAIFELTPALRDFTLNLNHTRHSRGSAITTQPQQNATKSGVGSEDPSPAREIPTLKRLVLRNCGHPVAQETREFIHDLIRNATGLEELVLDQTSVHVTLPIFLGLESHRLEKLKSLNLEHQRGCGDSHSILSEFGHRPQNPMRLKVYAEDFTWRLDGAAERVGRFLATQAATLEELRIYSVAHVPFLPELRKLQMWPSSTASHLPDEAIMLAVKFPALRTLDICLPFRVHSQSHAVLLEYPLPALAHTGVTHLSLSGEFGGRILRLASALLPSVTHCRLSLRHWNDSEFDAVWTAWPGLWSLHLNAETAPENPTTAPDLDELLTGIPESRLANLRSEIVNGAEINWPVICNMERKYKTRPGLSDLRQLQRFSLNIGYHKGAETPTDIGGYLGVGMGSPTLQDVRVTFPTILTRVEGVTGSGDGFGFSDECARLIRESRGQFTVFDIRYQQN